MTKEEIVSISLIFIFIIILIMIFSLFVIDNLKQENIKLKEQLPTWTLEYTCDFGVSIFNATYIFNDYERYLSQLDFATNVLTVCEVTND